MRTPRILLAALLSPIVAAASSLIPHTLAQRGQYADRVALVQVLESRVQPAKGTTPMKTFTRVLVGEDLKGSGPQTFDIVQIGGTDLPHDDPGDPDPGIPVLWIDAGLDMTVGKAAAQVGHAVMLLAGALDEDAVRAWAADGYRCAVRDADPERWKELRTRAEEGRGPVAAVRDAGFTEVAPGLMTVIAVAG